MKVLMMIVRIGGGVLFLALVLLLSGLFRSPSVEPGVAAAPTGIDTPKHQGRALRSDLPVWYDAVGTLDSTKRIDVAPRIAGQITALHAEVGDIVEAGALLAELDDRDLRARVEQARSVLRAAEASLEEARAARERTQRLVERQAATPEDLEGADASATRAEAGLGSAREALVEAQIGLDRARVTSPAGGVIRSRPASSGDMAWPGMVLFTLHDPSSLRIEALVREGLIGRVEVGQTLPVTLSSRSEPLGAIVREIVPSADPATRTFLVRAELAECEGLFPGMFGRLRLELDLRPVVLVPSAAVKRVGQLHTILTRHEDRWVRRYITVGERHRDEHEVLSGLRGGETIGWNE